MTTIEFHYDTYTWANVPLEFPAGQYATQDEWALAVAGAYALGHPDEEGAYEAVARVARVLPHIPHPALTERVWYLVNPYAFPLIANVFVVPDEATAGVDLVTLSGAYTTTAVRPPIVDTLDSGPFGRVARTISVAKTGDRERLTMQVRLAGRAHGFTIILEASTPQLDLGALALDSITDLMDGFAFN